MKILFLGGTKFFGKLIVSDLISHGHDVTIVSRYTPHKPTAQVQHIGDRNDFQVLRSIRGHWDAVIDNIAYKTEDIIRLFECITTDHYILTSSIATHHHPHVRDSAYGANKLNIERYLWRHTEIPWTIVRPGIVYGPDDPLDKTMWYMRKIMSADPVPFNYGQISFVFSEDLPNAYRKIINQRHVRQSFDLCGERIRLREFILHHVYQLTEVPKDHYLSTEGPYYYKHDFVGFPEYAAAMLNWEPTPWPDAIKRTITWIKEQLGLSSTTAQGQ